MPKETKTITIDGHELRVPIGDAWPCIHPDENTDYLFALLGRHERKEYAARFFTHWMLIADKKAAGGDLIAMCDTEEYDYAMAWARFVGLVEPCAEEDDCKR